MSASNVGCAVAMDVARAYWGQPDKINVVEVSVFEAVWTCTPDPNTPTTACVHKGMTVFVDW